MKYTLSTLAQNDVKNLIQTFYLNFGFAISDKYQKGLNNCFDLLVSEPLIGTSVDNLRLKYHKFPYKSHIVYYKIRKNDILIVRLLPKRMNEFDYL